VTANIDNDALVQKIVTIIAEKKPQNVKALVVLVKEDMLVSEKEVMDTILNLHRQGQISFASLSVESSFRFVDYLGSRLAFWYWLTLVLVAGAVVSFFTIPVNAAPLSYFRNVFGLAFILLLPGLAFVKAIFPERFMFAASSNGLELIARFALSIGVSIVLVPIVGLIFYYAPWGLNVSLMNFSLFLLTVTLLTVGVFREYKIKAVTVRSIK